MKQTVVCVLAVTEWVASHQTGCVSDFGGSTWENQTFFDFDNNLLSNGGITFLGTPTWKKQKTLTKNKPNHSISFYKNTLQLIITGNDFSKVEIDIYTLRGKWIISYLTHVTPEINKIQFKKPDNAAGPVYLVKVACYESVLVKRIIDSF
jgi:hypothetical protein